MFYEKCKCLPLQGFFYNFAVNCKNWSFSFGVPNESERKRTERMMNVLFTQSERMLSALWTVSANIAERRAQVNASEHTLSTRWTHEKRESRTLQGLYLLVWLKLPQLLMSVNRRAVVLIRLIHVHWKIIERTGIVHTSSLAILGYIN